MHRNHSVLRALTLAVLIAEVFFNPKLSAQPVAPKVDNRFLFIFDTSSDMKRRLPAVQKAFYTLLVTSADGQLHPGDSIGVWTFDQDLREGQFPLQRWVPRNAALMASNIITFVGRQHYAKATRFDALQPSLNQVVQDSERLTVLIFCDAEGEMRGTPYDTGINQILKQKQGELKSARLPFILVLRSQLGQYVGCTVNFPPSLVNFPQFPPLPPPPAPPTPVNPAPPPPVRAVETPPLIIVGTTITNHVSPAAPKPAPANPSPTVVTSTPESTVATEVKPPEDVLLMQTSAAPAHLKTTAGSPTTSTNAVVPPAESSGNRRIGALVVGVAFLAVAVGLTVFMFRRTSKIGSTGLTGRSVKKD